MSADVAPEVAAEARRLLEVLLADLAPARTELEAERRHLARTELERLLAGDARTPRAAWDARVAAEVPAVTDPWAALD